VTQVYEPFSQKPGASFHILLRATGDAMRLAEVIRREVLAVDPEQPVANVRSMDQVVAGSLKQDRFSVGLLGVFALLALLLAAVGIYGVMAYSVTERTHEIGLRMALGAQRSGVLKLVLAQSMRVVLAGTAIGLASSLLLTRLIASLLFQVKAVDPAILAVVALLLLAVALTAAWLPARRASRVDPMVALRFE